MDPELAAFDERMAEFDRKRELAAAKHAKFMKDLSAEIDAMRKGSAERNERISRHAEKIGDLNKVLEAKIAEAGLTEEMKLLNQTFSDRMEKYMNGEIKPEDFLDMNHVLPVLQAIADKRTNGG